MKLGPLQAVAYVTKKFSPFCKIIAVCTAAHY